MTVAISNTSFSTGEAPGGTSSFVASVTRASGEGLLIGVFHEFDWGVDASAITSVVWDAAGDNQAATLIQAQKHSGAARYLAVYYLAAPTSAKTANITVTLAGETWSRGAVFTRHITGHDVSAMVRASAKFTGGMDAATPVSNSVSSVSGDLVVDFIAWRNDSSVLFSDGSQGNVSKQAILASSRCSGSSSKAGDTSVSMGWSTNDVTSYDYAHILVSLAAASGGGDISLDLDADAIALSGSLSISGDIESVVKKWRVPTTAAESTAVHVVVLSGTSPTYTIAAQGTATVDASGNADISGAGTIGTKALAFVHNYDDNDATTSINGGAGIAELVNVG